MAAPQKVKEIIESLCRLNLSILEYREIEKLIRQVGNFAVISKVTHPGAFILKARSDI